MIVLILYSALSDGVYISNDASPGVLGPVVLAKELEQRRLCGRNHQRCRSQVQYGNIFSTTESNLKMGLTAKNLVIVFLIVEQYCFFRLE